MVGVAAVMVVQPLAGSKTSSGNGPTGWLCTGGKKSTVLLWASPGWTSVTIVPARTFVTLARLLPLMVTFGCSPIGTMLGLTLVSVGGFAGCAWISAAVTAAPLLPPLSCRHWRPNSVEADTENG